MCVPVEAGLRGGVRVAKLSKPRIDHDHAPRSLEVEFVCWNRCLFCEWCAVGDRDDDMDGMCHRPMGFAAEISSQTDEHVMKSHGWDKTPRYTEDRSPREHNGKKHRA